ncbi:uncharacterized protein LOC122988421 [Scomber scombrus]|uniref:Uncharacterized protein LOC122988421 n=1 Tax=Scomber scombrus TaxID=13677 RepID=A0AAV1PKS7_SCOSC
MTSAPRMRTVKSKEKIKVTTSNSKSTTGKVTTTCEKSGNIMRICVNLMPVLASAKEPMEEEKEEENNCVSEKQPETSCKNKLSEETHDDPNVSHTGLTSARVTETKQLVSPRFVLPPITQPKPAPECRDCPKAKSCHTLLLPISSSEQTTNISSNVKASDCGGDGAVTEPAADSRPWLDNPFYSKTRSAEFRLPDISLSSLEALLQTVTQKLGRRRGGLQRLVQSDQLFTSSSHSLSEKRVEQQTGRCTEEGNLEKIPAVSGTSAGGWSVNRQRRLTPLCPAPIPTLVLTMTKKKPPKS